MVLPMHENFVGTVSFRKRLLQERTPQLVPLHAVAEERLGWGPKETGFPAKRRYNKKTERATGRASGEASDDPPLAGLGRDMLPELQRKSQASKYRHAISTDPLEMNREKKDNSSNLMSAATRIDESGRNKRPLLLFTVTVPGDGRQIYIYSNNLNHRGKPQAGTVEARGAANVHAHCGM